MAPLLLLSIAVLSAGFERLIYWLSWRREQPGCLDALRTSLSGPTNAEASRVLEQKLRRLDRQFSRWEPSLDLAMVLGPLMGLLSTVLGLMKLLQALGQDLLLPRGEPLMTHSETSLVATRTGRGVPMLRIVVRA